MTLHIKEAVREKTHVLMSFSGPSGCGKTYSGLLLARGLVGSKGKIGFIDTEAKRARHYAELTPFEVLDMKPPFSPLRYIEHIKAFEEAGFKALVIDSMSHEWEGTGGCMEMAEGKKGLLAWQRPKADHRKLMNHILQSQMHIIFCCRAKEKMVQVKNQQTGKDEIVSKGIQPILEKNFIFEMTISMMLDEQTKIPVLTKCPEQLLHAFPQGVRLTSEAGEDLAKWAEQGIDLDLKFEALAQEGREIAGHGLDELREWYGKLSKPKQASIEPLIHSELKSIAEDADRKGPPEETREADPFTPKDEVL